MTWWKSLASSMMQSTDSYYDRVNITLSALALERGISTVDDEVFDKLIDRSVQLMGERSGKARR